MDIRDYEEQLGMCDEIKKHYREDHDLYVCCCDGMDKEATEKQVGGDHYDLPIQPVKYIHANGLGFIEGNIVKYITRHRQKNGAEDIKKIIHYCELLLALEYGDE